jgi:hypothetical protein
MANEMGRPPKPESERRSILLNLRVTGAERKRLVAEAKRRGLSISDLMRKKLLGGKDETRKFRTKG